MAGDFLSLVDNQYGAEDRVFEILIICYVFLIIIFVFRCIIVAYLNRKPEILRWILFINMGLYCAFRIVQFVFLRLRDFKDQFIIITYIFIFMELVCEFQLLVHVSLLLSCLSEDLLRESVKLYRFILRYIVFCDVSLVIFVIISFFVTLVLMIAQIVFFILDMTNLYSTPVSYIIFAELGSAVSVIFNMVMQGLAVVTIVLFIFRVAQKTKIHTMSSRRKDLFLTRTTTTLITLICLLIRSVCLIVWLVLLVVEEATYTDMKMIFAIWVLIGAAEGVAFIVTTFFHFMEFKRVVTATRSVSQRLTHFSVIHSTEDQAFRSMLDDMDEDISAHTNKIPETSEEGDEVPLILISSVEEVVSEEKARETNP